MKCNRVGNETAKPIKYSKQSCSVLDNNTVDGSGITVVGPINIAVMAYYNVNVFIIR